MLPRVIIHNAVTADGRLTGFMPDMGLYYELAGSFGEDLTLSGADTALAGLEQFGDDELSFAEVPPVAGEDRRPLFAITDSRGRVREWSRFLTLPFWRGGVALCSRATPTEHLDYLASSGIDVIIAGERRVDLRAALEQLADRYGIKTVRTDSGGSLNAALLEQNLVDELSLLVSPWLVGEAQTPLVGAIPAPVGVELASMKEQRGGYVWLRYALNR